MHVRHRRGQPYGKIVYRAAVGYEQPVGRLIYRLTPTRTMFLVPVNMCLRISIFLQIILNSTGDIVF